VADDVFEVDTGDMVMTPDAGSVQTGEQDQTADQSQVEEPTPETPQEPPQFGEEEQPEPKYYTEDEVAQIRQEAERRATQSATDKITASQRDLANQQRLQGMIQQEHQRIAMQFQNETQRDRAQVEQGLMSEEIAQRNYAIRLANAKSELGLVQKNAELELRTQQLDRLGKIQAGFDIGAEIGVDPWMLINDQKIQDEYQMRAKAWEIKSKDQSERGRVNSLTPKQFAKGPKAGTAGSRKTRTVKPGTFAGILETANSPDDILKSYGRTLEE